MRLKDKVAIITGGAEGIGKAYALGFAKEGAKIVVADINLPASKTLVEILKSQGNDALAVKTDVSSVADTENMVEKTIKRFGKIDILINNAAVFQRVAAVRKPVWELDPADFEKVIKVNITGVFLCCRAVLPHMIKQKSGKIINIASSLAFLGAVNLSHYAASKGGVVTFTRSVAREVGQFNINVNSLCPGFTLSADPESITEERRQYEVPARILKKAEYPEDLVGTAIFLASADSDFMTGQAVVVDGGVILH
jgi:NAD(P)-dependent dehydrogenase (short-subunit alcohol dehydrogenase family)